MASKNVETITRAHKAFNNRQLEECAGTFADDGVYKDVPRGAEFRGHDRFMDFMQGWIRAFSDCQIAQPRYIDAGDQVICEFRARGVNDGPLGTFKPTNRKLDLPYCEIVSFDKQNRITQVTSYYDLLSLLSQLGHLQAPREAQIGASPRP